MPTSRPSRLTSSISCSSNASGSVRADRDERRSSRAPTRSGATTRLRIPSERRSGLLGVLGFVEIAAHDRLAVGEDDRRAGCRSSVRTVPGGITSSAWAPAVAITRATPSSASTIAIRSNGTRPRSSRMNSPNASSRSSDELSARAQRLAASSRSARRPSSSRSASASSARRSTFRRWIVDPPHQPADEERQDEAGARLEDDVVRCDGAVAVEDVGAALLEPDRDRAPCARRDHETARHPEPEGSQHDRRAAAAGGSASRARTHRAARTPR